MIAHLDKNRSTLVNVGRDELFEMILSVSNHTFVARGRRTRPHTDTDEEVAELAQRIKDHLYRMQRGERQMTYRELRQTLSSHGFSLENPNKNSIDVIRIEQVKQWSFFSTKVTSSRRKIGNIPIPARTES